jgi:hypothetical protein
MAKLKLAQAGSLGDICAVGLLILIYRNCAVGLLILMQGNGMDSKGQRLGAYGDSGVFFNESNETFWVWVRAWIVHHTAAQGKIECRIIVVLSVQPHEMAFTGHCKLLYRLRGFQNGTVRKKATSSAARALVSLLNYSDRCTTACLDRLLDVTFTSFLRQRSINKITGQCTR